MSKIEYEMFEWELALYTSSTLLGVKCSSLISLSTDNFNIHTHIKIFNGKASRKF